MLTCKTYRKHTAADIVAAAVAKPSWTNGGNLIASMPDGYLCIHYHHPHDGNGYTARLIILNCMSVHSPRHGFGCAVAAMAITAEHLDALDAASSMMFADLIAAQEAR